MPSYLIFFNQQWVGDHPAEWYDGRGLLARGVVTDMAAAGVLVFAGGLEEDPEDGFFADDTGGELEFGSGPYSHPTEFIGGMTIVDVPDEAEARLWAGRIATACGWPQEVRRFKG